MKKLYLLLGLLILLLSGCGKVEVRNAAIPLALGTDFINNEIVISAQIANPKSPEQQGATGPEFNVITASGKTFSEASRNTSLYFSSIPLWSHIQMSVLGENMAKHGIRPVIDFLARNRYARKNNLIVVTHNASPEEVLNVKSYLEPYTAMALKRLLRNQEPQLGIYTPIDTTDLLQRLANPGIEVVIPMVTIQKNGKDNQLLLDGSAVFKKDKMVGILNEQESRGYHLLRPKTNLGGLFLVHSPVSPEEWVTLEISRSQATIKPVVNGSDIRIKIKLQMEGNFYEQSGGGNLFTPEAFNEVEQAAQQELKRQITMTISKAQSLNSDILGWGYSIYRSDPETWEQLEANWDQIFPGIPYEIEVQFDLRRSYLTDKSFVFR